MKVIFKFIRGSFALFMGASFLAGCSENHGTSNANNTATTLRQDAVTSMTTQVIVPALNAFVEAAHALRTSTDAYGAMPDDSHRASAQAAWIGVMNTWQAVEVLQIGPTGPSGHTPGGRGYRDEIYAWPVISLCRIDEELIDANYEDSGEFSKKLVNVRGLGALEVLLFRSETTNSCSAQSHINMDGSWDRAVGDGSLPARRAAYAKTLALLIEQKAEALLQEWSESGGNFQRQLTEASSRQTVYGNVQEALNAIFSAIFYVETETKDMKLGRPLGMPVCESGATPELLESHFAKRSKENVVINLATLQKIFEGGESKEAGVGFDDLLKDVGAQALADDLDAEIRTAVQHIENISEPFEDLLGSQCSDVKGVYDEVKTVTNLLKTELVTNLDLEIPERAAGDTD